MKLNMMILMVDSGIKNQTKNQMDIIQVILPEEYKAQYESKLKAALYSYKR